MLINIDKTMSKKFVWLVDRFYTFLYDIEGKNIIEMDIQEEAEITDKQNSVIHNKENQDNFLTKATNMSNLYTKFIKKRKKE